MMRILSISCIVLCTLSSFMLSLIYWESRDYKGLKKEKAKKTSLLDYNSFFTASITCFRFPASCPPAVASVFCPPPPPFMNGATCSFMIFPASSFFAVATVSEIPIATNGLPPILAHNTQHNHVKLFFKSKHSFFQCIRIIYFHDICQ